MHVDSWPSQTMNDQKMTVDGQENLPELVPGCERVQIIS